MKVMRKQGGDDPMIPSIPHLTTLKKGGRVWLKPAAKVFKKLLQIRGEFIHVIGKFMFV